MKLDNSRRASLRHLKLTACAAAVLAFNTAHAGTVDLGDGFEAVWTLDGSLSGSWRAGDPDLSLVGIGDGGSASSYPNSLSAKNFSKGDNTSTLIRLVGDVNIKKGDTGVFLRAKLWDDLRYSQGSVRYGAPTNSFAPNTRLSDSAFDTNLSKFSGAELLDAYAYTTFDLAGNPLKVKLGNQLVNWGEALFVPGVNQYNAVDISATHQAGALLKEVLLPVPQISMNFGLPQGYAAEAFYKFGTRKSAIDGCGTYWSIGGLNCSGGALLLANDPPSVPSAVAWNGIPGVGNFILPMAADRKANNPQEYGLSMRKHVDELDTEFGLYYVNYAANLPVLSGIRNAATVPGSLFRGLGSGVWDYSAKDIKVAGLSASTGIGGWSVSGEMSYSRDVPVAINGVDFLNAFLGGVGPVAGRAGFAAAPPGSGAYVSGYDLKNKTQIQVSTIKTFSNVLGASNIAFLGEAALQHWSGIGDPYTSVRYGRGGEFGSAQHASYGGACLAAATNAANCTQDGYATANAWGLRAQVELEYPNLFASVNFKPRLFISQDVKGWSADGMFVEDRRAILLGAKFEYLKKYALDLSYTNYNRNAKFDSTRDRDYIAVALSAAF